MVGAFEEQNGAAMTEGFTIAFTGRMLAKSFAMQRFNGFWSVKGFVTSSRGYQNLGDGGI